MVAVLALTGDRRRTRDAVPETRPEQLPRAAVLVPFDETDHPSDLQERQVRPAVLAPRHVEGRVVVPPTDHQVVSAAMSRPQVRLAVLAHGVAYALRAESRDRIVALMRREYRRRRRERLAAGRRALRAHAPGTLAGVDRTTVDG